MNTKSGIFSGLLLVWLAGAPLQARVLLGTEYVQLEDTKNTEVVTDRDKRIQMPEEKTTYRGLGGFVEIPFTGNSLGLVASGNILIANHDIYLSPHTIENYEFFLDKEGEERATFDSGDLRDFNITENLEQSLRDGGKERGIPVAVRDTMILGAVQFKYTFPTHLPWEKEWKPLRYFNLGLDILNLWVGGGFSTVLLNREFTGVTFVQNKKTLPIRGRDPAPDPDFHLMASAGVNLKIPGVELFGTQLVLPVHFSYSRSLNPDNLNKPFDDGYIFKQETLSMRFGVALMLE